jgi:hypothetical protein
MKKIVDFTEAKDRQSKKAFEGLAPAFPTKEEIEYLNAAADRYRKMHRDGTEGTLPYPLHDGRELKFIWDSIIVPMADLDNLDPWDVAGVFFSKSHGLNFTYSKDRITGVTYPNGDET